jgi:uncharacterized spore protein YtfJ
MLVLPVTLTALGSSFKLVAPVTTQDKVEDCPFVIEFGEAVNEESVGNPGGGGVGCGVGVGVGVTPFAVVNVKSPDVDRLPASSFDFTL